MAARAALPNARGSGSTLFLPAMVSICTRNCTTNLRQRCTTFAARRAIEKSATLQQHCTTNLHQRCTTFDSVIRCCNQHSETPPGVMVC